MDDVWDDSDDDIPRAVERTPVQPFQKDLEKLEEIHSNEGYKAGIVAGQSKSTQEGFDAGYRKGAESAIEFGKSLGQVIGLSHLKLGSDLQAEIDELVREGWKLSDSAGKQLSKEEVEEFRGKCDALIQRIEAQEMGVGTLSSS